MSVLKHGMPSGTFNPQFNMIPTHLFCNTFKMSDTCINMTRRWYACNGCSSPLRYIICIDICSFCPKHVALRSKSKDCLARNQANVSEWSDMSTRIVVSAG